MSRADFWAFAGIVAMNYAVRITNEEYCPSLPKTDRKGCKMKELKLIFKIGRKDCSTSPWIEKPMTSPELPSAFLNLKDTLKFYKDNFNMESTESVAITGGHSLGRTDNADLKGTWEVGNIDGFNNRFFKNMINKNLDWKQNVIYFKL